VIDQLWILAGNDHLPYKDGGYAIAMAVIVFVEGHDQKAVVGKRPLYVTIQVLLQPAIGLLDRAVMHIVVNIGYHE
jgi:hypothetical protein